MENTNGNEQTIPAFALVSGKWLGIVPAY